MTTFLTCVLIASAVFAYYRWLLFIKKEGEIAEKKDLESRYSYSHQYVSQKVNWESNGLNDIIIPMPSDSLSPIFTADSIISDFDFGGGSFGGGGSGGDYDSSSSDSSSSFSND